MEVAVLVLIAQEEPFTGLDQIAAFPILSYSLGMRDPSHPLLVEVQIGGSPTV
jgi:hypothetical protein